MGHVKKIIAFAVDRSAAGLRRKFTRRNKLDNEAAGPSEVPDGSDLLAANDDLPDANEAQAIGVNVPTARIWPVADDVSPSHQMAARSNIAPANDRISAPSEMVAPSETASEPTSRLLDLPQEVLQRVFRHLLVEPTDVMLFYERKLPNRYARAGVVNSPQASHDDRPTYDSYPGIEIFGLSTTFRDLMAVMLTCKRFSCEAPPIFYGENAFLIHSNWSIPTKLSPLMRWINRVSVWCYPRVEEAEHLHPMAGLTFELLEEGSYWTMGGDRWRRSDDPEYTPEIYEDINRIAHTCFNEFCQRIHRADPDMKLDLNILADVFGGPPRFVPKDLIMCLQHVPEEEFDKTAVAHHEAYNELMEAKQELAMMELEEEEKERARNVVAWLMST